jgi:hypothetical protein
MTKGETMLKTTATAVAGVGAAIGSALCCAGPMIAVGSGVSGAGLVAFEPLRPYFLGTTAAFLAFGFLILPLTPYHGTGLDLLFHGKLAAARGHPR